MRSRSITGIVFIPGIAVLAVLPILIKGIPFGPDSFPYYRICISFYHALRQGDWFPSWVATSFGGYGDLAVRFYPPLTFYVAALFRTLTGSWYTTSLLLITLFSLVGALGVYFWVSSLITPKWAIVSAAIFCFLPFHVTELYTALCSLSLPPLVSSPSLSAVSNESVKTGSANSYTLLDRVRLMAS